MGEQEETEPRARAGEEVARLNPHPPIATSRRHYSLACTPLWKCDLYRSTLPLFLPFIQEPESATFQPVVLPILHHLILHRHCESRTARLEPHFQYFARLRSQLQSPLNMHP